MKYRKPRVMTERQGRRLYKHLGRILAKKAEEGLTMEEQALTFDHDDSGDGDDYTLKAGGSAWITIQENDETPALSVWVSDDEECGGGVTVQVFKKGEECEKVLAECTWPTSYALKRKGD